jgi:hypothetical protein
MIEKQVVQLEVTFFGETETLEKDIKAWIAIENSQVPSWTNTTQIAGFSRKKVGKDKPQPQRSTKMTRMWINQPSSLQPYHKYNGTNVLAHKENDYYVIYFLSGNVISMIISPSALSLGWV